MNTKKVPLFIMLLAGAVACIMTYINHYNLHDMLVVLLIVLIIFLILGLVVKKILDKFDIASQGDIGDEGEVVKKLTDEELSEGEEGLDEAGTSDTESEGYPGSDEEGSV